MSCPSCEKAARQRPRAGGATQVRGFDGGADEALGVVRGAKVHSEAHVSSRLPSQNLALSAALRCRIHETNRNVHADHLRALRERKHLQIKNQQRRPAAASVVASGHVEPSELFVDTHDGRTTSQVRRFVQQFAWTRLHRTAKQSAAKIVA
jgi:hypothetical protein